MAVDANKYFRGLKAYLNTNAYEITKRDNGRIVLEEKIFLAGGAERKQKVRIAFSGEVIALKLDLKNKQGNTDPLFHFLEDDARPWSKRCDFVIFQLYRNKLSVYCIEFKSASLPASLVDQLSSTESWCKAVQAIINLYTNEKKRLHLKKFVFSTMVDPSRFVDEEGYIIRDHSIRHYHYDDINGMKLEELDNQCPVLVG
ncbi:hypothetical protein H5183_16990 [Pseudoalteromonas sp. SR44-8]|nr:hypothetical protein [Pseudoalteromonas sp. SR44-8]